MRIVVRKRQSCYSTDWSMTCVSRRWDNKVSAQFVIQSSGTPGISRLKKAAISLTLLNFLRLIISPLSSPLDGPIEFLDGQLEQETDDVFCQAFTVVAPHSLQKFGVKVRNGGVFQGPGKNRIDKVFLHTSGRWS